MSRTRSDFIEQVGMVVQKFKFNFSAIETVPSLDLGNNGMVPFIGVMNHNIHKPNSAADERRYTQIKQKSSLKNGG
jgi:hypothetical protein